MPVKIGVDLHIPEPPIADLLPDTNVTIPFPVYFSQEMLLEFPANFQTMTDIERQKFWDTYPPDKLKEFMDKYKYQGMRLKHNIKDRTIPLSRNTLDIP